MARRPVTGVIAERCSVDSPADDGIRRGAARLAGQAEHHDSLGQISHRQRRFALIEALDRPVMRAPWIAHCRR